MSTQPCGCDPEANYLCAIHLEERNDAAALATPPTVAALRPDELLRLGALTLQEESSDAVESLITEQQATYREILRTQGPQPLIQALLDRDRQLARTGREMASGRTASRLLREFVRGVLNMADYRSVRQVGDATKTGQIEKILEALGAEAADLRQLKESGSTLGRLDAPEERDRQLRSGELKL